MERRDDSISSKHPWIAIQRIAWWAHHALPLLCGLNDSNDKMENGLKLCMMVFPCLLSRESSKWDLGIQGCVSHVIQVFEMQLT